MLQEALNSSIPWKYHLSMSGQEFPLRTNLEMVQILRNLNGSNDIENYEPSGPFIQILQFKSVIGDDGVVYMTKDRRPPLKYPEVEPNEC